MTAKSVLEQYSIADLLEWYKTKKLKINPIFQRRDVWTADARSYLIDTILQQLPIPKIFMRTKVDLATQKSYREVVDGQQRLRAIFDFASGKLRLNRRSKEFQGKTYDELDAEHKETFLSYALGAEQLMNASDDDVLEIFSRINSYTVSLNPPEKRHAKFQNEFAWSIHGMARKWDVLWDRFHLVTVRQRVRMLDDSFMAELYGLHLDGVSDGGQIRINKLYERHKEEFSDQTRVERDVDAVLQFLTTTMSEAIVDNLAKAPHFLMLYAAVAHAHIGIPSGQIGEDMPERNAQSLSDIPTTKFNLGRLNDIIGEEEAPEVYGDFWFASRGSTQRIRSRKVRFLAYFKALQPESL